ncbi:hypothetical protein GH741_19985 [Aquibacillus halophilus]|uniref:Uncharacterized protein n=1 Tax=Aquibacillus halophilus TaxID=930132 RepID=A0A6A8DPF5_9BACI|nr:hypothetical protein [Aquibacillus halophilus]
MQIEVEGSRLLREKRQLKIPQEVGFLPRKLKRCPRKATARSVNKLIATLRRNFHLLRRLITMPTIKKQIKRPPQLVSRRLLSFIYVIWFFII